ncbi:hypothetical protein M3Y98_00940600 [Aphelenchoides besseyi]|nr:hypothetical protein M3Y98_00940600 [Aphelenchoides besseyi]KAI6194331.1 hypothetical protein M3Y96_01113700 [Aphelenchoides besseyi]
MEFRLISLVCCLLLLITVDARFYRNRGRIVRVVPVEEVETDEPAERSSVADNNAVGKHLIALRPDWAFMHSVELVRNIFERRPPTSERRRRAELADAYLRRQLRDSLFQ